MVTENWEETATHTVADQMSGVAKRLTWNRKKKDEKKVSKKKPTSSKTVRERVEESLKNHKKEVPKKVSERRDKNKEKFLKVLEEMPIVQVAASRTGTHRSTYYRWYEEDEDFRNHADKALSQGRYFVNDMMESLLIKLAKEGKVAPIIFWLKNHHERYMDVRKYEHFHHHEIEENPLTQERLLQIEKAMYAWDSGPQEYVDEDYEVSDDETDE